MVNHERATGRPVSPDPFSDCASEPEPEPDEGMLERPCYRFNTWHKRECEECMYSEKQGHFDSQDGNDNEMEEREIVNELIPDLDISESSSGSLTGTRMLMDVEIGRDVPWSLARCQTDPHPGPLDANGLEPASEIPPGTSKDEEVIQDFVPNSVPQAKDNMSGYADQCEAGPLNVNTEFAAESQVGMSMDVDEVPAQDITPTSFNESDTSSNLDGIPNITSG